MRARSWVVLVVLGLLLAACAEPNSTAPAGDEAGGEGAAAEQTAAEEGAESCYEGETATFTVSFEPGGGYDQIARILAPALERELGGTVIVENVPGAGGLLAMRDLLSSEPDGLRFGFFAAQGIVGAVLGEEEGADFELLDFTFVGRVAADQRVLAVTGSSEWQTLEDVLAAGPGLRYATSGVGSADYIDATVLNPVLGLDAEIITGFESSSNTELAVTTGDTDLGSGTLGSRLSALENGDHRPILALDDERLIGFDDVPSLAEIDLDEENRTIADAFLSLQETGRMVWAPPGVPENCRAELESAFATVLADPEIQSQMEEADQLVDFRGGEDMRAVVEELLDAPESFSTLLREAYASS